MMKLPKELTTVTKLSKYLAMLLFIALPFVGFFLGIRYQEMLDLAKRQEMEANLSIKRIPTPTTDETSSISICAPKFTIEHAMELTASESYSNQCYNQTTKDTCEKVDIYRASTKNFGNSDGIPDCQWIQKQEQTVDTANWKTYRNNKFGFSVKFPSDWNIEEDNPIKPDIVIYSTDNSSNLVIAPISEARYTTDRNRSKKLADSPTVLFSGRSAREYKEEFENEFKRVFVRDIQIEDLNGLSWTKPNEISYWVDISQPELLKVFDQILSTFKFTQ